MAHPLSTISQTNINNTTNTTPNELPQMYDTVFSLIEEELYQRLHPETYKDVSYDGTQKTICPLDNRYINFDESKDGQKGGGKQNAYIPGKIDAIRASYQIPLQTAIEGTLERQKLYAKEMTVGGLFLNHFC
jgi:hypothetical protein